MDESARTVQFNEIIQVKEYEILWSIIPFKYLSIESTVGGGLSAFRVSGISGDVGSKVHLFEFLSLS